MKDTPVMNNTIRLQLRQLVAGALYPVKAHTLPSVCERYGMDPGTGEEAFASKNKYLMKRLEKLSDERVLTVAKQVVEYYPSDGLKAAIEKIDGESLLLSEITRNNLANAFNDLPLGGAQSLEELLGKHWPEYKSMKLHAELFGAFMNRGATGHPPKLSNGDKLRQAGFIKGSQSNLFAFLSDVLHPVRQTAKSQEAIIAKLNPILRRDGYVLSKDKEVSGYPTYKVIYLGTASNRPADAIISETLSSFDESGVHQAWKKALERRSNDPEGAITAAKTLLETVCKHIVDEAGGSYGNNDDLPKLYNTAAEFLSLAPSQHSEQIFKAILGNCQSIVGNLAGLRNKLGDSHGQGKRYVKPLPRHAELAVNLAGSVAMFLIATWNSRQKRN